MKNTQYTLQLISGRTFNNEIKPEKVLVLYEEELLFMGDCCTRFDKFRYFRTILDGASVNINFTAKKNSIFHRALLHNNPHIDSVTTLAWEEIDFHAFDTIFCIMYDEPRFLEFLHTKYETSIQWKVYSISDLLLKREERSRYIFPGGELLLAGIDMDQPGELYITDAERAMADSWLRDKGFREGEDLYIVIDASSTREKLINISVYFDVLKYLLQRPGSRLLAFDERNVGKEQLYREWLGDEAMSRVIFSKDDGLRHHLCLLGSSYTKMVFGPCTGLLHCASGIYNHYVNNGMTDVPVLITYTGQYSPENRNADFWWGKCPLINCLMLKEQQGKKTLLQLSDLTPQERELNDTLACSAYTAPILIGYMKEKLDLPVKTDINHIKNILLLYEEELQLLGESCLTLDKLRYIKMHFRYASLSLNFCKMKHHRYYDALLKNNPYIGSVSADDWSNINFLAYDMIIYVGSKESELQQFLNQAYGQGLPPVYSMSDLLLKSDTPREVMFPVLSELRQYFKNPLPAELYIFSEEQEWADHWLEEKGLLTNEELYIVVDASPVRSKLLNFQVYFDMLKGLLAKKNTKILVFDERKQGKRNLYKGWLGEDAMSRMIFSEGQSLREDLCLIGSSYTKLVVGPCTGLMHCASGIFNHYISRTPGGMQPPLIVVYTGKSADSSYNLQAWWGSAPLVSCLLLKQRENRTTMLTLAGLENNTGPDLPCSSYTAEMLLEFINNGLPGKEQETFIKIQQVTADTDITSLSKVIILYEEKNTLLGDACIKSDKFRYLRSFFHADHIHLNFTNKQNQKYYEGLLKNNPYIDNLTNLQWEDIRFEEYNAVICITHHEDKFLKFLHNTYGQLIADGSLHLPVYSMSKHILQQEKAGAYIFPESKELFTYMQEPRLGELYISREEREWANNWLESKGLKKHEQLFIILDSSAVRSKLLNIDVYFSFVKHALQLEDTRVLIFDEKNAGKDIFYREWLGDAAMNKIIFSSGLTLRQDLCLIGSDYTRIMFGPCTGLMHCASGIFNNYVSQGMNRADVPLLVVYTGWYGNERYDVSGWWENSPLVNCLFLKEKHNRKELTALADMTTEERQAQDSLPCTAYTADILWNYIDSKIYAGKSQLTV